MTDKESNNIVNKKTSNELEVVYAAMDAHFLTIIEVAFFIGPFLGLQICIVVFASFGGINMRLTTL